MRKTILVSCLAALLSTCPYGGLRAQDFNAHPVVATLAGTGEAGMRDGRASESTFLLPIALAISSDGTIFIADQMAQRIRTLSGDTVRTVAGTGELGPEGLSVRGGFRDGPAGQAQFNKPTGLAIGPDSAVYIADSGNSCIRKLQDGIVSTVAGKPGDAKPVDGDVKSARLVFPRALAFGRNGDLYIADYGVGLRRLDREGRLTTIASADVRVLSLAMSADGDEDVVLANTPDHIVIYKRDVAVETLPLTDNEAGRPFGHPGSLVTLHEGQYLFTDAESGNVRYLRLSDKPYVTTIFARRIAGGDYETLSDNADFRDGSLDEARFYDPAGIAVRGNTAYVADAGNRRIRRIGLPPFRVSESVPAHQRPTDATHLEIAFVGSTEVFYDSLGGDSICAGLEKTLDAARQLRPARCHAFRYDGATLDQLREFIENSIVPRNMDVVVLELDAGTIPESDASILVDKIKSISDRLRGRGKFVVALTYRAPHINGREFVDGRERRTRGLELPRTGYAWHEKLAARFNDPLSAAKVSEVDLYQAILEYERTSASRPIFGTAAENTYPYVGANVLVADSIGKAILPLLAGTSR